MSGYAIDTDAVTACADLAARTGAREFQLGYLHDGVPIEQAGWWAHASYHGGRITVTDRAGPDEAADALARRLLTGAQCRRCGGLVTLSDDGAFAFGQTTLTDGRRWDAAQAGLCRWHREGALWVRGCDPGPGASAASGQQAATLGR